LPDGIATHADTGHIYWTNIGVPHLNDGSIERADLDGENERNQKGQLMIKPIKPIGRVAIIGTGVIGASWTALFLAKGLKVAATDVAPNAEAALKEFVKVAWPALERLGLAPGASQSNVTFTAPGSRERRRLRPGEWARADRLQEKALCAARRAVAGGRDRRLELVRPYHERDPIGLPATSRALHYRPSLQSTALDPAGRNRWRR
jgi:3-hydroxyacyl-CoA dehydrogenase, NAD binding domain